MNMLPLIGYRPFIRGDIIRSVLEGIDVIGSACKQLLIDMIETDGIILDQDNWHRLSEIERSLSKTFGGDATPLLMKRMETGIAALYHAEPLAPVRSQTGAKLDF